MNALIVDDSLLVRQLVENILEELGLKVGIPGPIRIVARMLRFEFGVPESRVHHDHRKNSKAG